MGKRGPKPVGNVKIKWSTNFAYAIGLLATDGCLSGDKRHIDLTSKDREQLENFIFAVKAKIRITQKDSSLGNKYLRVQFSDVLFYNFLLSIGFTPAKSKTLKEIVIPKKYFFDFLRGNFDGDGSFYSYWDPRWKSSHMFYLTFGSASKNYVDWIRKEIFERLLISGHISKSQNKRSIFSLRYAKKEALEIIKKMYYTPNVLCLSRKRVKIIKALAVEKNQQKSYS